MSMGDTVVVGDRSFTPVTPLPDHVRPGDVVMGELAPGLPTPAGGLIVATINWTGANNRWSRTIGLDPVQPGEGQEAARRRVLQAAGWLP